MAWRNTHRVGDHLMRSDKTGRVHYKSEMVRLWDGSWVHKSDYEGRQPQEFVRAKADPRALKNIRGQTLGATPVNNNFLCVGETNVPSPTGPASHLYSRDLHDLGIGGMEVSASAQSVFFVR